MLTSAGLQPFLDVREFKHAAIVTYRWRLKESIPLETRLKDTSATADLHDVLSYLLELDGTFGFTFDLIEEVKKMIFVIRNKMHDSK